MWTLYKLGRAGFHSVLMFVLPWGVGAATALYFDVSEVSETASQLAKVFTILVLPAFVLQMLGILIKLGRERRIAKDREALGFRAFVDALDRHVRVLTPRGVWILAGSLAMVFVSLTERWAQFGVLAVFGLGLVYAFVTTAMLVSAFLIPDFERKVTRRGGKIDREFSPPTVDAGDSCEERFYLSRIPVPPGFRLHIHEKLPARLGGETRFVADSKITSGDSLLTAPLDRTARGEYQLGPAAIWYEDILGLTHVFVASRASAFLRVLPRLRPLSMSTDIRLFSRSDGPLSLLSRLPSDDWFRIREYLPYDDVRRIHWKLSIKSGTLNVRTPETTPLSRQKVVLALDTYRPQTYEQLGPGLDHLLDVLVEVWISLAHELSRRGQEVSVVVPLLQKETVSLEVLRCRRGEERLLRVLGARVAWQAASPFDGSVRESMAGGSSSILISALLSPLSAPLRAGQGLVVASPQNLVRGPDPLPPLWRRFLFYQFPPGAEENRRDYGAALRRFRRRRATTRLDSDVAYSAPQAIATAKSQGAATFYVREQGQALVLEPA